MAKLKAHGAELARAALERLTPESELTQRERTEQTLMEDGKIMEKRTIRFRPSSCDREGRCHAYGCKLRGKLKADWNLEQWIELHTRHHWVVERKAEAPGERPTQSRFKMLTAEVCNVHRLWKLLGPIVLRRRKQDAGEEIVPRLRNVIRCDLGTLQQRVYQYYLQADYVDKNGQKAVAYKKTNAMPAKSARSQKE